MKITSFWMRQVFITYVRSTTRLMHSVILVVALRSLSLFLVRFSFPSLVIVFIFELQDLCSLLGVEIVHYLWRVAPRKKRMRIYPNIWIRMRMYLLISRANESSMRCKNITLFEFQIVIMSNYILHNLFQNAVGTRSRNIWNFWSRLKKRSTSKLT